jgi:GAF domain-containing protein
MSEEASAHAGSTEGSAATPDLDLQSAREIIRQQSEEIAHLQGRLEGERLAEELRDAFLLVASAGIVSKPASHPGLLEMIVQVAAHVISARAASLALIERETQELTFEVALGQQAEELKKLRVPLGHGIAGLVAVSGQPMAVSSAQQDPRHASDIARAVGYQPQSILCVPLVYNDEVIGVLELLDKLGAPSFSPSDIEVLGLFANQAAIAIEESRVQQNLAELVVQVLGSLGDIPNHDVQSLQHRVRTYLSRLQDDTLYRQTLDLAGQVQAIAKLGENELRACKAILQVFADFFGSRGELLDSFASMGLR